MRIVGNDRSKPRGTIVTTNGDILKGSMVVVNSNGTVSQVTGTIGSKDYDWPGVVFSYGNAAGGNAGQQTNASGISAVFVNGSATPANNNKIVITYTSGSMASYGVIVVGEINSLGVITFGVPVFYASLVTGENNTVYDPSQDKICVVYKNVNDSNRPAMRWMDISGNSITNISNEFQVATGSANYLAGAYANNGYVIAQYTDTTDSNQGRIRGMKYSNNSTVIQTNLAYLPGHSSQGGSGKHARGTKMINCPTHNKAISVYNDDSNGGKGTACAFSVDGTGNIAAGSPVYINSGNAIEISGIALTYDTSNNNVAMIFTHSSGNGIRFGGCIANSSNNNLTAVSPVEIKSTSSVANGTTHSAISYHAESGKMVCYFRDEKAYSTIPADYLCTGTRSSGASFNFVVEEVGYNNSEGKEENFMIDATDAKKVVQLYHPATGTAYGYAAKITPAYASSNLTASNYIGASSDGKSSGGTLKINTQGSVSSTINSFSRTYTVYVVNPGAGNIYQIIGLPNPGAGAAPLLTLYRGNTYTFDLSDSTNATHPLAFQTSAGASYTDGVTNNYGTNSPGSAGSQVVFKVPLNAPDSLKYICSTHGAGMGNSITVKNLEIGKQYYVLEDGSLSTTAGTTVSVIAGTAISATDIIIKG